MLPDMDGWELLARLKELPELSLIPVVIISIVADPNKGFSLGAAAVMQKPISRQQLFDSLTELGLLPVARGSTCKVLVVDDDPASVELVAVRVAEMGGTVLRAYGGAEAIAIAEDELPDVIVLDLMMPVVSGFEVVEALNANPQTSGTPVLIVTSKEVSPADRARLNGYVAKIMEKAQFNPEDFTTEVRRAMAGRKVPA
jgi:CheY-like chemotaxis protein